MAMQVMHNYAVHALSLFDDTDDDEEEEEEYDEGEEQGEEGSSTAEQAGGGHEDGGEGTTQPAGQPLAEGEEEDEGLGEVAIQIGKEMEIEMEGRIASTGAGMHLVAADGDDGSDSQAGRRAAQMLGKEMGEEVRERQKDGPGDDTADSAAAIAAAAAAQFRRQRALRLWAVARAAVGSGAVRCLLLSGHRYSAVTATFARLFPADFDRAIPVFCHKQVDTLLGRLDRHHAALMRAEHQFARTGVRPMGRVGGRGCLARLLCRCRRSPRPSSRAASSPPTNTDKPGDDGVKDGGGGGDDDDDSGEVDDDEMKDLIEWHASQLEQLQRQVREARREVHEAGHTPSW
jgi:hypothetical protein